MLFIAFYVIYCPITVNSTDKDPAQIYNDFFAKPWLELLYWRLNLPNGIAGLCCVRQPLLEAADAASVPLHTALVRLQQGIGSRDLSQL
jgi:hypothetical protein